MIVISLISSKGGSSKSTLSAELGIAAHEAGAGPVAWIDTDPQATLAKWWQRRSAPEPVLATMGDNKPVPKAAFDGLRRQGIKICIVDTAGYTSAAVPSIITASDLVLVPCRASPNDLETVVTTLAPIERARVPFACVISGATTGAKINEAALRALARHGPVAPVTIHSRVSVPSAHVSGLTTIEAEPSGRAAGEFRELWAYVVERLAKHQQTGEAA